MGLNFGRIALAAAVVASAVIASPVVAQERGKIAQLCRDDIQKYCSGIQPGGGRLKPCVKENYQKFSDTCKVALRDMVAEKKQSQ